MRLKIKAIIFDMGGVLVVPKPGYEHVGEKWETNVDMVEERKTLWWEIMKGKGDYEAFNRKLVEEGVFDEEFMQILFDREKREGVNWKLVKIIKKLRKKLKPQSSSRLAPIRLKIGLLTNNWAGNIEYYSKKLEGYSMFDVMISSHQVGMVKPDPEIFKKAARRLGVRLTECVFVDDWEKNVEASKKLGMKGIIFKNNEELVKELKRLKLL